MKIKELLKTIALVTIILVLGAALVSCDSEEPAKVESPDVEGEEEVEEAAEPVNLVYWSMWNEDEPQGQVVSEAVAAYEAANPNVTVEVVWYGREIKNLLPPAIEAGETIDVYDFRGSADYALPLTDFLSEAALGEGYADSSLSIKESILPALWTDPLSMNADGVTVGVPYSPYVVMVFYNKDHFEAAGINNTPETWEEFLAVSDALLDAGFEPFTEDIDAYMDVIIGVYGERALTCDGLLETFNDPTGEMWSEPGAILMAEAVYEYSSYLAEGTEGNLYPAGQQRIALDEVTMNLNGSWLPSELQDLSGPDFNWGVFSFPNLTGGAGSNSHVDAGSQFLAVSKATAYQEESLELLRYLIGYDAQMGMVSKANSPAAHIEVSWAGPLVDAFEAFKEADEIYSWGCGVWDTGEVFTNVVIPNFTDLFLGNITPEEFVEVMTAQQSAFWSSQE